MGCQTVSATHKLLPKFKHHSDEVVAAAARFLAYRVCLQIWLMYQACGLAAKVSHKAVAFHPNKAVWSVPDKLVVEPDQDKQCPPVMSPSAVLPSISRL